MPKPEILIEPSGREPETRSLGRGLEGDIDLPVLDLQLDQLQSDGALAHRNEAQRSDTEAYVGGR